MSSPNTQYEADSKAISSESPIFEVQGKQVLIELIDESYEVIDWLQNACAFYGQTHIGKYHLFTVLQSQKSIFPSLNLNSGLLIET